MSPQIPPQMPLNKCRSLMSSSPTNTSLMPLTKMPHTNALASQKYPPNASPQMPVTNALVYPQMSASVRSLTAALLLLTVLVLPVAYSLAVDYEDDGESRGGHSRAKLMNVTRD